MTGRELPRAEWGRLKPKSRSLLDLADDAKVYVAEDAGRIVGQVMAVRVTHLEGLEIEPDYRGNVAVGRLLLRGARQIARPARWAWAGAASECMRSVLRRLGAKKLALESYVFKLEGA